MNFTRDANGRTEGRPPSMAWFPSLAVSKLDHSTFFGIQLLIIIQLFDVEVLPTCMRP